MLWYYAPTLLMLLQSAVCAPREKVTEKPDVPPAANPKFRKPTHISEFTDPDTGLNPFLDLEEGRTSLGRNVMEDERTNDEPYFGVDLDLIEGDATDRRWNLEEPKEHFGRSPGRWSELDIKEENHFVVSTTPFIPPNPPTTVDLFVTKDLEKVKSDTIEEDGEVQHKIKKEGKESFVISRSTVIYASATIAVVAAITVLVGACWWRKKLKTSRTTATVENGEVKS